MTACSDWIRSAWRPGDKEWWHLSAQWQGSQLLANMLIEGRSSGPRGSVTIIALMPGGPVIQQVSGVVRGVRGGSLVSIADSSLSFDAGGWFMRAGDGETRLDVRVEPVITPTTPSVTSFANGALAWSAVPRCRILGQLVYAGRGSPLGPTGYADHNWGSFAWGPQVAWEWCYAHCGDFTVVWMRMLRRSPVVELARALLLWRGNTSIASWRGPQLTVRRSCHWSRSPVAEVPARLRHLVPPLTWGVPGCLEIQASRPSARFTLVPVEAARILIADDDGNGASVINEVACDARLQLDNTTAHTGSGMLEVMHAA